MRIAKLSKVRGHRIFRDFYWPAQGLDEFGRFNLIYGWNGSGKTTLSNLFRHLQERLALTEGEVSFQIDDRQVTGKDLAVATLPEVRVFNRDSVARAVFESHQPRLPPVFYFGEESAEKQKEIELHRKELEAIAKAGGKLEKQIADARTQLEKISQDKARAIKLLLTSSGGGEFNNFNAGNFKAGMLSFSNRDVLPESLDATERERLIGLKGGEAMAALELPSLVWPNLLDITTRTKKALGMSVVSTAITELADDPALSSWVAEGLPLHRGDPASADCKFCGSPLRPERIQALEAHFNTGYRNFMFALDRLEADVRQATQFATSLRVPQAEALYPGLRAGFESALRSLRASFYTTEQWLAVIGRALAAKRGEPFRELELAQFLAATKDPVDPGLLAQILSAISGVAATATQLGAKAKLAELVATVEAHNKQTASYAEIRRDAQRRLADDELLQAWPEWKQKNAELEGLRAALEKVAKQSDELKSKIAGLEREILEHRRPAEELTDEVASYLGRRELSFEVQDNGYSIRRDGQVALNLSEGERTAIAFLYFLKSLRDKDFDLTNGIVVIDDPVSSLDANSLFSAFGHMQAGIKGVGQLFVLTHNFSFFRLVKNWLHHLPKELKRECRHYMVRAMPSGGARAARLQELDPLLRDYESEYHYLFKRVFEEANKAPQADLSSYYEHPNLARRLLESFLAFRLPGDQGKSFHQRLDLVDVDAAVRSRIYRFLNAYSHSDRIAEPDHDLSLLSEAPVVMADVLGVIQRMDEPHFRAMKNLVAG
ncbi:MAG TPA: AAA family ATPase [Burkholderiaceae bacterium]|nr:AAA family ATPase [Burkholderiaceae bacterium]